MRNIRGIRDLDNDGEAGLRQQNVPLIGSGLGNSGDPRKESFFIFLKNFICPMFTWKSVIFFITMIDIIVYFLTLSLGIGISTPEAPYFLPPLSDTLEYGSLVKYLLITIESKKIERISNVEMG